MKKKVQAIIKKIRLAVLIPLGFTLIVLLGCYFFVIRTHGDGQAAKSFFIFSVIVLLLEIAVLVGMTYLAKKGDPFRHGYVVGRTRSSRFW